MWNSLHKRLWHIFKLIDAISIVLLCEIEDMNEKPNKHDNVMLDFEKIVHSETSYIIFQTNVDEKVLLSRNNPIRIVFNESTQEPSPYIIVRENIEARIDRKSFYRLIELGEYSKKNGIIKMEMCLPPARKR